MVTQSRVRTRNQRSLEEAVSEEGMPMELRSGVRELLEARGATVYGHLGSESLTEDERVRIKNVLDRSKATA